MLISTYYANQSGAGIATAQFCCMPGAAGIAAIPGVASHLN